MIDSFLSYKIQYLKYHRPDMLNKAMTVFVGIPIEPTDAIEDVVSIAIENYAFPQEIPDKINELAIIVEEEEKEKQKTAIQKIESKGNDEGGKPNNTVPTLSPLSLLFSKDFLKEIIMTGIIVYGVISVVRILKR